MVQTNHRLWTKNFFILSLVNFFLTLVFFILIATLPAYAVDKFQASTNQAGLVGGIFVIGSLVGRLFTGRVIHSIGPKRILMFGLIFLTFTTFLYFLDYGITLLILSRFIHGITVGIAITVVATMVALSIPESRKGEGISYFAVSTALATGLGPFIGIFMSQHTNFEMILIFCILLGVLSLKAAFFFKVPIQPNTETKHKNVGFKLSSFIEPKVLPISIIVLTMTFCFSSVLAFISLYAVEVKLFDTAGFFFMFYSASVLISRPFTGRWMDKKGANFIMYPAFIIFGLGMLLLSSASNSLTFLLAGALIGLGFGNISSIAQAIAVNRVSPHRMGVATSTFFIFFEIGIGFGPYLIGLMIPIIGYNVLYVSLGIIIFATSILYYCLHGKKERANELLIA